MFWTGKYIIGRDGRCRWVEFMAISDPNLLAACAEEPLVLAMIELCEEKGVKFGVA